jgi:hypothetical protein
MRTGRSPAWVSPAPLSPGAALVTGSVLTTDFRLPPHEKKLAKVDERRRSSAGAAAGSSAGSVQDTKDLPSGETYMHHESQLARLPGCASLAMSAVPAVSSMPTFLRHRLKRLRRRKRDPSPRRSSSHSIARSRALVAAAQDSAFFCSAVLICGGGRV